MQQTSQIHFIGGEKGGVGKSVVARLIAQYWIDHGKFWYGYDTDKSHGALLRYYSDFSQSLDIDSPQALDRLVELAVDTPMRMLIDLAAQTETRLHNWIEDSGVQELADDNGLRLRLWYVVDDGKDSLTLLGRLLERIDDSTDLVLVKNYGRGDDFSQLDTSEAMQQIQQRQAPVIELKGLYKPVMRKIDQYDKSFWAAVNNTDPSRGVCLGLMERQRVKTWLKNVYNEFDSLEI